MTMMTAWSRLSAIAVLFLCSATGAQDSLIHSYTPVQTTGTLANFEGFAKGTIIGAGAYAGVTFGQSDGGTPMIDTNPFLYGYSASSGVNVLTGSTNGGAPVPTIAGITATFSSPTSSVQAYLSDTSPLGNYVVTAYGVGGNVIETQTVLASELGANHPGIYVGFTETTNSIAKIQFGPGTAAYDAFAIDDLLFLTPSTVVPEPSSLVLCGIAAAAGLGYGRARRNRAA